MTSPVCLQGAEGKWVGWISGVRHAHPRKGLKLSHPAGTEKPSAGSRKPGRGGLFQGLRERLAQGTPPLLPGPSLLTPSTVLLRGGEREASDSFLKNRILKVSSLQCFRGGG